MLKITYLPNLCVYWCIMIKAVTRSFPSILKYKNQQWDLPIIWTTRLFQTHIEELASVYDSSGTEFFRATTGIQSGPEILINQGSKTFLTILGNMEILCSFRLVLERKISKEMPESSRLEFLEKF